jgi:hypothetical protein
MLEPCKIRSDGKEFFLTIPATKGQRERTLHFPITRADLLSRVLTERERLGVKATIGTIASPTEKMIEVYVQAHGATKCASGATAKKEEERIKAAEALTAKLGGLEIEL